MQTCTKMFSKTHISFKLSFIIKPYLPVWIRYTLCLKFYSWWWAKCKRKSPLKKTCVRSSCKETHRKTRGNCGAKKCFQEGSTHVYAVRWLFLADILRILIYVGCQNIKNRRRGFLWQLGNLVLELLHKCCKYVNIDIAIIAPTFALFDRITIT